MAVDPKKKADFEAFRKRARKFPVPRQELQARVDCRVELESRLLEIEEKKTLGFLRSNTVERGDFLNVVPVNGSKGHPYGKKKSRKPERVSVYFVRFRSKRLPFYKFLKIGISNVGIGVRFTEDRNFKCWYRCTFYRR